MSLIDKTTVTVLDAKYQACTAKLNVLGHGWHL